MAGDWIKMEIGTSDKPEIWVIAEELDIDPDAVVGKLFRVWCWFDQNTEEGNAPGVSKKLLDRIVGVTGFCDAVMNAGWMVEQDGELSLPNFERLNGETAKKRALTARRVAKSKLKSNAGGNASNVTIALPREEKRREDIKKTPTESKKKGTRLLEKSLPEDWLKFCKDERPELDPQSVFDQFHDYWVAQAGQRGVKLDWTATWRNWVRRQDERTAAAAPRDDQEFIAWADKRGLRARPGESMRDFRRRAAG